MIILPVCLEPHLQHYSVGKCALFQDQYISLPFLLFLLLSVQQFQILLFAIHHFPILSVIMLSAEQLMLTFYVPLFCFGTNIPRLGERVLISWSLFEILTPVGFTALVKTLCMNWRFSFTVKQKKLRHCRIWICCSGSKNTLSRKNGAPCFEFSTSVVCGLKFMMS